MEHGYHHFSELFKQLGLGSQPDEIKQFICNHNPLADPTRLPEAPFWTSEQATFLQEALDSDSDWSEVVDKLNAALRKQPS